MERVKCFLVELVPETVDSAVCWRRAEDHSDQRQRPRDFGPGAMWYADDYLESLQGEHREEWLKHYNVGPDGRILMVLLPNNRTWNIDSRASNCTMKDDNEHRCWVRHGVPPEVTVDKNGLTCNAGAGSIAMGDYHGFLRNGYLEKC